MTAAVAFATILAVVAGLVLSASGAVAHDIWTSIICKGRPLGVISSIFLVIISPGIISIPLGFLGCWLGTMLGSGEESERSFDELYVRSETGLGAEGSALEATQVSGRNPAAV